MPLILDDILTAVEAQVLHEAAQELAFEDGARSAGRQARAVKHNLQAAPGPARDALVEKLRRALWAHPAFQAAACPRNLASVLISRTEGGGQYGDHVDNALMGGGRADLSFTLFLSPPDSYDGGALVMSDRVEDRAFKLERGALVLYPSDSLHRVESVTRGSRIVMVGWVTSWLRDPRQREIVYDLWQAMTAAEAAGDAAQVGLLSKSRSNLLRMWAV